MAVIVRSTLPLPQVINQRYRRRDLQKRAIDGVMWASENMTMCIKTETIDGVVHTIVDLDSVSSPPPTMFAIETLKIFAGTPDTKKLDVVKRVMDYAMKPNKKAEKQLEVEEKAAFKEVDDTSGLTPEGKKWLHDVEKRISAMKGTT